MSVTGTLSALPTSFGATIIQANALLLQAGDYSFVDWRVMQKRIDNQGRSKFRGFPGGKTEDPNVVFMLRNDLSGVNTTTRTIVALWTLAKSFVQEALNTATMATASFAQATVINRVASWHYADILLSSGMTYNLPLNIVTEIEQPVNPETAQILAITNYYQAVYENLAFSLKQVAAGAPLFDPYYAAQAGLMPV